MLKSTEIFQLTLLLSQMKLSGYMTHTLTTKLHFSHYSVYRGSIQNLNSQVFQDSTYMKNFHELCFVALMRDQNKQNNIFREVIVHCAYSQLMSGCSSQCYHLM